MADHEGIPIFAFINEGEQAEQLREFLVACGAKGLPDKFECNDEKEVAEATLKLVAACDVLGMPSSQYTDEQIEAVLNSICSLVALSVGDKSAEAILKFSDKLSSTAFGGEGWKSRAGVAVRVLSNLFHSLQSVASHVKTQSHIYMCLLTICSRAGLINELPTDLVQLESWFVEWKLTVEQRQAILRALRTALSNAKQTESTAKIMLALLATYKSADSEDAIKDAHNCVRTAIIDPKVFVLDHLLRLEPVQRLKGKDADLWQLLQICVSGVLSDYQSFIKKHPATFTQTVLNVTPEHMVQKMRTLTLISMAEKQQELGFDELRAALNISNDDELEEFIISAMQAKIDGIRRCVCVRDCVYRRFDEQQWQTLRQQLTQWHGSLVKALKQLKSVEVIEEQPII